MPEIIPDARKPVELIIKPMQLSDMMSFVRFFACPFFGLANIVLSLVHL